MLEAGEWADFAVAMAGVAAVLAGLVFVGLSVNLERILGLPGLPGRAGETVVVFVSAVVQCALLLVPGQSERVLGVELLIGGVVESVILLLVARRGIRHATRQPWQWDLTRVVAGQVAALPVAVAGVLVLTGAGSGLYWVAGAVLWAILAGTANAWVLVVEVARDERYLPLTSQAPPPDRPG